MSHLCSGFINSRLVGSHAKFRAVASTAVIIVNIHFSLLKANNQPVFIM